MTMFQAPTSNKGDSHHAAPTDDGKLLAVWLQGMVEALQTQEQHRAINKLSFLERLWLLVNQQ
jgi:hypothetical protein